MERNNAPSKLQEVEADLRRGMDRHESVRTLLSWFRAERRGRWVVHEVQQSLRALRLKTEPDFRYANIDESISFHLRHPIGSTTSDSNDAQDVVVPFSEISVNEDSAESVAEVVATETSVEDNTLITSAISDPTYRLGRLPSANVGPLSLTSDDTLNSAITHMLANQFSQLPIIDGRTVRGKVSWRSIGSRLAMGMSISITRDCIEPCEVLSIDSSLFSAIDYILRDDCVLVRDRTNRISGIVTAHDLSVQFNQLGEPFLLIGEIENHIRRLLADRFTAHELNGARDPSDSQREVTDIGDLTFGECLRIMQNRAFWERLSLSVSREVFTTYLDEVRIIRNDVMHFDPEGIETAELARLRMTVAFFQQLSGMRAIAEV